MPPAIGYVPTISVAFALIKTKHGTIAILVKEAWQIQINTNTISDLYGAAIQIVQGR